MQLVGSVQPPVRFFVAADLSPYTEETFVLELCNAIGCRNSSEVSAKTKAEGASKTETAL